MAKIEISQAAIYNGEVAHAYAQIQEQGATAWGTITGNISDQSDLNTALAAKAPTVTPNFTAGVIHTATGATHFILKKAGLKSWTMQEGGSSELTFYPSASNDGSDWVGANAIQFFIDGSFNAKSLKEGGTALNVKYHPYRKTGTAAPNGSVVPAMVGDIYVDTTAKIGYMAVGLTNADWKQITN